MPSMLTTLRMLSGALVLALLLWAGAPVPAVAADTWLFDEVDFGRLSIGGHATYYKPDDGDEIWRGGAQLRLHLTRMFAIEGLVDYWGRSDFNGTKVYTYPVQASALIYLLPGRRLSPFILGGAGWYYTTVDHPNNGDDTDHRFGLHAGGGLQLFLTEHFSIDGTYRYIWLEEVQARDASLQNKEFGGNGHMVTVGLNFHF